MKFYFLLPLLYILIASTVSAEPTVNVVTEEMPPLSYFDFKHSRAEGIHTDVIRAVMDDAGLAYTVSVVPWVRAFRQAKIEANTIIFTIGRIPEREDDFIWLKHVFDITYDLYGLKENKTLDNVSDSFLFTLPVAVSKDDAAYTLLLQRGFSNPVYINNYEHMLKLLSRGRVDMIASNSVAIHQLLDKNPDARNSLRRLDMYISPSIKAYFAISKQTHPSLVERISRSFQNIVESGQYQSIMNALPDLGQDSGRDRNE